MTSAVLALVAGVPEFPELLADEFATHPAARTARPMSTIVMTKTDVLFIVSPILKK